MTRKEGKAMRKYLGTALVMAALIGASAAVFHNGPFAQQAKQPGGAQFTPDGKMKLPTGYREWVFLGSPLTPNALNGGKASFPEFHNVGESHLFQQEFNGWVLQRPSSTRRDNDGANLVA